jgi:hypothetical protein
VRREQWSASDAAVFATQGINRGSPLAADVAQPENRPPFSRDSHLMFVDSTVPAARFVQERASITHATSRQPDARSTLTCSRSSQAFSMAAPLAVLSNTHQICSAVVSLEMVAAIAAMAFSS